MTLADGSGANCSGTCSRYRSGLGACVWRGSAKLGASTARGSSLAGNVKSCSARAGAVATAALDSGHPVSSTSPPSSWRRRTGPALGRIKRQEQRGIARSPGLAPRAIAFEASGNLDAPGIRIRQERFGSKAAASAAAAPRPEDGGIPAGGRVRRCTVRQSARHQSSRTDQVVVIKSSYQVVEECQQPEPGPARMAETTRMRSFASPAARVLRSVGSRWQTGWRSARALSLMIIR